MSDAFDFDFPLARHHLRLLAPLRFLQKATSKEADKSVRPTLSPLVPGPIAVTQHVVFVDRAVVLQGRRYGSLRNQIVE